MRRKYANYEIDGEVDENGVIANGGRVITKMTMMDSQDSIAHQVSSEPLNPRTDYPRVRAADGSDAGLHRPGARFAAGIDPLVQRGMARDMAEIYAMYDAEKAAEYRGHPGGSYYRGGPGEWRGGQPGDPCTLNGFPGTLVEKDGKLVCRIKQSADASFLPVRKKQKYNSRGQEKGSEIYEEEDDDRERRDGGVRCPTCNGSGQLGWLHSGKEPDDDTESMRRRDVPDAGSLPQLRAQRQRAFDAAVAAYDAELVQLWRKG
jgi:hypothetical protein